MTHCPLVSILIPAYNHENFVEQTLNSVLEDEYANKEIIIINDGSKDNTDTVINLWKNKNQNKINIVYRNRENKGLTKTLNELISLSKGTYVILIASDDYLINNSILQRVEYLESHTEKMVVFADCIVVDANNNQISSSGISELYKARKQNFFTNKGIRREVIERWSLCGPVLMLKKEIYSIIGGYDENLAVEDWDFALRAVSQNLYAFLDVKVSAYRVHGKNSSLMKEKQILMYKDMIKILKKNYKLFNFEDKLLIIKELLKTCYNFSLFLLKNKIDSSKSEGNTVKSILYQVPFQLLRIFRLPHLVKKLVKRT